MTTIKPAARRRARQLVLQAIYQWQLSGTPIDTVRLEYYHFVDMKKVDTDYFNDIVLQIPPLVSELDQAFGVYLDRPLADLTPIELAILRLATYELLKRLDVPYQVVINEALELTKSFGATEAHKYVNGVHDKVAKDVRKHEGR